MAETLKDLMRAAREARVAVNAAEESLEHINAQLRKKICEAIPGLVVERGIYQGKKITHLHEYALPRMQRLRVDEYGDTVWSVIVFLEGDSNPRTVMVKAVDDGIHVWSEEGK